MQDDLWDTLIAGSRGGVSRYLQALWQEGGSVLVLGPARGRWQVSSTQYWSAACPLSSFTEVELLPKVQSLPQHSTCTSASSNGLKSTAIPVAPLGTKCQHGKQSEAKHLKKANTASLVSTNNPCSSFPSFQALT